MRFLENDGAQLAVPQGNHALVLVSVARQDFDGPVKLDFAGLPPGLTATADPVPAGQAVWPVVLSATPEAAVAGGLADVSGALDPQDAASPLTGRVDHEVVLVQGANKVTFFSRHVDRLAVAVAEPAPFSIEVAQPKVPLVRNGNMKLKVIAKRQEGFKGAIDLRVPWVPGGVGAGTGTISADATETEVSLDAQNGAAVGKGNIAVAATSGGYAVCSPFIALDVAEPWVSFEVAGAETEQGKPTVVTVKVNQAKEFEGTVQAELLGLPKGASTTAQPLVKGATELKFPVDVAADAPEGKHQGIFVRAVLQAEGENVLHQSGGGQLAIFKPLPAELQKPPEPPKEEQKQPEATKKTRFAQN